MIFSLSERSLDRLNGVHPDLVSVARHCIGITTVDFGVTEGVRLPGRQAELMKIGASKTLESKHLLQPDGYSHAFDVCAYVGRQVRWDWPLYYEIAEAMKTSANKLGVTIIWGGVWDKTLNELGDIEDEVAGYIVRRKAVGSRAFIDGPHYQLVKKVIA